MVRVAAVAVAAAVLGAVLRRETPELALLLALAAGPLDPGGGGGRSGGGGWR